MFKWLSSPRRVAITIIMLMVVASVMSVEFKSAMWTAVCGCVALTVYGGFVIVTLIRGPSKKE